MANEQLTFADLPPAPPKPSPSYAWLHAPLTREEQAAKDMIERMKNAEERAAPTGPQEFDWDENLTLKGKSAKGRGA